MKKLFWTVLVALALLLILSACEKEVEVCSTPSGVNAEYDKKTGYTMFYVDDMPCIQVWGVGLSCDWSRYHLGEQGGL